MCDSEEEPTVDDALEHDDMQRMCGEVAEPDWEELAAAEPTAKRSRTFLTMQASSTTAAAASSSDAFSSPQKEAAGAADDDISLTQDAALASEQQRAYNAALGGSNLFLTGGPGVGKSFTLRKIIEALEDKHGSGSVLVWAPTGVAAILVGGQTMQSKPGPGIGESSEQFDNVWGHKKYWRAVRTLVLDEVSMADAEFIDWVESSVRALIAYEGTEANPHANAAKPFGGLQLIFCGDFCQLPPVPVSQVSLTTPNVLSTWERRSLKEDGAPREKPVLPVGTKETKGKWAFQTACWRDAQFEAIELQKSFRTNDDVLLSALHELRWGHASHPAVQRLVQTTQRALPPRADGIKPTVLYPTKKAVEHENLSELGKLDASTEHTYPLPGLSHSPPPRARHCACALFSLGRVHCVWVKVPLQGQPGA